MASPGPKLSAKLGLFVLIFLFAPRTGVLSPKPATAFHALGENGGLVCVVVPCPLVPASPIPSPSQ
jgi:hypothetical protein